MVLGAIAGVMVGMGRLDVAVPPGQGELEKLKFFEKNSQMGPTGCLIIAVCKAILNKKQTLNSDFSAIMAMEKYKKLDFGAPLRDWEKTGVKVAREDVAAAVIGIPYGWTHDDPEKAAEAAKAAAHDIYAHTESKKAAYLMAGCISALRAAGKKRLRGFLAKNSDFELDYDIQTCTLRRSDRSLAVLEWAVVAFLEGGYFEESLMSGVFLNIRTNISLAIVGALSEAAYKDGTPKWIQDEVKSRLGTDFREIFPFLTEYKVPHVVSLAEKALVMTSKLAVAVPTQHVGTNARMNLEALVSPRMLNKKNAAASPSGANLARKGSNTKAGTPLQMGTSERAPAMMKAPPSGMAVGQGAPVKAPKAAGDAAPKKKATVKKGLLSKRAEPNAAPKAA